MVQHKSIRFCVISSLSVIRSMCSIEFPWCSGYHICVTHRRSPVRSRAKAMITFQKNFIIENSFRKFSYLFHLFISYNFIYCQKGHTYSKCPRGLTIDKRQRGNENPTSQVAFSYNPISFSCPKVYWISIQQNIFALTIFALEPCKTNLGQHVTRVLLTVHWVTRLRCGNQKL